MKLSKVKKATDKIIDESQRQAIVELIDLKSEDDMKQIIAELRADRRANQAEHKSMHREFVIMRWILGLVVALLIFVLSKIS